MAGAAIALKGMTKPCLYQLLGMAQGGRGMASWLPPPSECSSLDPGDSLAGVGWVPRLSPLSSTRQPHICQLSACSYLSEVLVVPLPALPSPEDLTASLHRGPGLWSSPWTREATKSLVASFSLPGPEILRIFFFLKDLFILCI